MNRRFGRLKFCNHFPGCRPLQTTLAFAVRAFGLDFSNPVGLVAGFDKNGEVVDPILRLGFGFTEVGTITPLAQAGNPPPRLFRLDRDQAVINRLGFRGAGHAAVHARLTKRAQGRVIRRDQSRCQQRLRRSPRRLCAGDRGFRRCRGLFCDQCFFAEHAGVARFAARQCARRSSRPRACRPRRASRSGSAASRCL